MQFRAALSKPFQRVTWMRVRERTAWHCSVLFSSPSQPSSQPVLWRSVEWRESRRAENSPGWLGWGIACWEVSRRSGITGQTERVGRRLAEESGPEGGHVEGMTGWAHYLKSRLVAVDFSFWTLTALTVDRESGHFLALHNIAHSCLSQWHLSLFLPWLSASSLHVVTHVKCSPTTKPANQQNFDCSVFLQELLFFHKANVWQSS